MKAILQKDVANVGREGDVVRVTPGFFRNFLLPNGMAKRATDSTLKELEFKKKRIEAVRAEKKSEAEKIAADLNKVSIEIRHRCGEKGQLFGSVTPTEIAQELREKGYDVDRRKVVVHEPIKHIGDFKVTIRVYPEVAAKIKLTVKPEADQEAEIMANLARAEEERKQQEEAARKAAEAKAKEAEAAAAAEATEEATEEAAPAEESSEEEKQEKAGKKKAKKEEE